MNITLEDVLNSNYPTRIVKVHSATPYKVRVAPISVFNLLWDKNGNATSERSEKIDNKIACYIDDEIFVRMPDAQFEEYINNIYYDEE